MVSNLLKPFLYSFNYLKKPQFISRKMTQLKALLIGCLASKIILSVFWKVSEILSVKITKNKKFCCNFYLLPSEHAVKLQLYLRLMNKIKTQSVQVWKTYLKLFSILKKIVKEKLLMFNANLSDVFA